MTSEYGDISPRTAAYAATTMLERAMPALAAAKFGQQAAIPRNKTNVIKWRRYNAFVPNTTPLVEGVTPTPDKISSTDVTETLRQYGRRVEISDVIQDTHEDPVLNEYAAIMGELAGQTMELVVYNAIRSGTAVIYNNGGARNAVNTAITATTLNRAIRQLKRQNARYHTRMLAGTDKVGTSPVRPAFIAFCHPDVQTDLEALPGFKVPAEYGTYNVVCESEFGSYKEIRFVSSSLYAPFVAAGASGSTMLTNGAAGTGNADVYPVIITAMDSYATVSLAGSTAVAPVVVNAKPSDSDPLAQRSHVGFKMWSAAKVLNDAWMVRVETAVTA